MPSVNSTIMASAGPMAQGLARGGNKLASAMAAKPAAMIEKPSDIARCQPRRHRAQPVRLTCPTITMPELIAIITPSVLSLPSERVSSTGRAR